MLIDPDVLKADPYVIVILLGGCLCVIILVLAILYQAVKSVFKRGDFK